MNGCINSNKKYDKFCKKNNCSIKDKIYFPNIFGHTYKIYTGYKKIKIINVAINYYNL